jgi:hypothetical protein
VRTEKELGPLTILVNNAGMSWRARELLLRYVVRNYLDWLLSIPWAKNGVFYLIGNGTSHEALQLFPGAESASGSQRGLAGASLD